jgi:hypothetical protein
MPSQVTVSRIILWGVVSGTPAELMVLGKILATASLIALAIIVVGSALRRVRGTTLVAPLLWALVSLLAVTAAFIWQVYLAGRANTPSDGNWWLIAICSTFCPLMSLLGAKRPQHKAWQWIVVSFWIVAALPAIQALALQPGEPLTVPIVWRWFYAALLLMGAVNYLPTRYALTNLLFTAGQTILFWPFLPPAFTPITNGMIFGISLIAAAICLAGLLSRIQMTTSRGWRGKESSFSDWTNVWLDFRDAYGVVWGVRVMERIESLLQSSGATASLQWNGFRLPATDSAEADRVAGPLSSSNQSDAAVVTQRTIEVDQTVDGVEPGIRNLLRRFVSNDWIDRRLRMPR